MNSKLWIGVVAGLLLGCATGCKRIDADVSSDGKSLVVTTNQGFAIHTPGGREQNIIVPSPPAEAVRWSHSQNQIAYVDAKRNVAIYSLPDKVRRVLKWKATGPFAWSADDRRLALVSDTGDEKLVQVVDPSNSRLLAQESAGKEDVQELRWTPDGKSLVASHQTSLSVMGGGATARFVFDGKVLDFAVQSDRSVGVLVEGDVESGMIPNISWVDCDLVEQRQTVIHKDLLANRIPVEIRDDSVTVAVALAPNGTKIAVAMVYDHSPTHAFRALSADTANKLSKAEKSAFEDAMELQPKLLVINVNRTDLPTRLEDRDMPINLFDTQLRWSADSQTLAVVDSKGYKILKSTSD